MEEDQGVELAMTFEPAVITADFEGIEANVKRMLEPYEGVTSEMAASMDLSEIKTCCADLRRISKELNDGRKAIKKAYNKPLEEFESRIKEIDELIKAPLGILDAAVKAADEKAKQELKARLEAAYRDFAPAIADLVDFDRIMDPKWLNKSFGEKKAENAMTEKVAGIGAEYQSFERVKGTLAFPDESEAEFWRTLSLSAALDFDAARQEEQARIAAMHAEREGYALAQADEPQPCVPEEPAYYPPEPEYAPPVHADYGNTSVVDGACFEPVSVWMVAVEATEAQKLMLTDYMRSAGMHGNVCRTAFSNCKEAIECVRRTANEGSHL